MVRSACVVFREISRGLECSMPGHLRTKFLAEEPLEKDMAYLDGERLVRYQWEEELISDWLQALQQDADAALPGDGKPGRPACPKFVIYQAL